MTASTWTLPQAAEFVAFWALSPKNRDMPGLVFALTHVAGRDTVLGLLDDAWAEVFTVGCLADVDRLDAATVLLLGRFQ